MKIDFTSKSAVEFNFFFLLLGILPTQFRIVYLQNSFF